MDTRRGTRNLGATHTRTTLIWVAIVIVVLVVIDIALVSFALGRTAPNAGAPAGPIPTFSSAPDSTASPTPSPSATTEANASVRHFLSAVDGTEAWRASSTKCGGPVPTLEHSVDGGATWVPIALGPDVSTLMAIRASSTDLTILAGIGDDCTTTVRASTDGGATWVAGSPGAAGAGVSTAGIVLATGVVDSPCSDPIEAYQGQQTSLVICDGQVEWRSGAGDWVDVPVGGVRSMADNGDEYLLARVGSDTCAGVEIDSMTAIGVVPETNTPVVGCNADAETTGPVSLDRAGESVWLWAGEGVSVSSDGGVTW